VDGFGIPIIEKGMRKGAFWGLGVEAAWQICGCGAQVTKHWSCFARTSRSAFLNRKRILKGCTIRMREVITLFAEMNKFISELKHYVIDKYLRRENSSTIIIISLINTFILYILISLKPNFDFASSSSLTVHFNEI